MGGTNAHIILDDALHYMKAHNLIGNRCTVAMPHDPIKDNGVESGIGKQLTNDSRNSTHGNSVVRNEGASHKTNCRYDLTDEKIVDPGNRQHLLVLSAADKNALKRMTQRFVQYFERNIQGDTQRLDRLASTLSSRRGHLLWRLFIAAVS